MEQVYSYENLKRTSTSGTYRNIYHNGNLLLIEKRELLGFELLCE